jgi:hypothetical protein
MKPSTDPIWNEWIKLFIYYSFSRTSQRSRDDHIAKVALAHSALERKSAIIALSVAKWHPLNPYRGNGVCFCCKYHQCATGCPAILICGPQPGDNTLYHKWFVSIGPERSNALADEIYEILLTEYRRSLKGNKMAKENQSKQVCMRHFGKRICHTDVAAIPEGLEFKLVEALEDPKDGDSDTVLRCTMYKGGRAYALGDFGGVKNIFDLSKVPVEQRMAVYVMIAKAADKVDAS